MAFKVPRIRIDPQKLKQGIWGNTWKNWGQICLAFLALYAVEAGYFTGLLYAAKEIRGDQYKSLTSKFFGDFDTVNINSPFPLYPSQSPYFNRPQGCVVQQRTFSVAGQPVQRPNGIQACDTGKDGNQWVLFPWTLDTKGLGKYPGCANPSGAASTLSTFISKETSLAYTGNDVVATPELVKEYVCQNFVPTD